MALITKGFVATANNDWSLVPWFFKDANHVGNLLDERQQIIDEVVIGLFLGPHSYTKEDVVEISCHGSEYIVQLILQLFLRNGARLADPGEFTMRAFLNGRIDLSKAEAVLDIISAKTDAALTLGLTQLAGGLSDTIKQIRQELVGVLAHIEAAIDFFDEDIEPKKHSVLLKPSGGPDMYL